MATVPTLANEVPGNFITAAMWNANVYAPVNFLLNPVRFKAYASAAQSIATGTTSVPLLLDTEIEDTDGGHSTTTNTSRYVCQTPGVFYVSGSVCFVTNTTATRTVLVMLNGTTVPGSTVQAAPALSNGGSVFTSTTVRLAVGDYVEIGCWQNTSAALSTSTGGGQGVNTTMNLFRISN